MTQIVLSLLAKDRPGIVKDLSDLALAHGANWLESRMAQLAGQFAGLVLLEAPEERVPALVAALRNFDPQGAHVLVEVGSAEDPAPDAQAVVFSLDGADHPGIVHRLSQLLASMAMNIVELETDQRPAPMSGHAIFTAEIRAHAPAGLDRATLSRAVESLANELLVEIRLRWPDEAKQEP